MASDMLYTTQYKCINLGQSSAHIIQMNRPVLRAKTLQKSMDIKGEMPKKKKKRDNSKKSGNEKKSKEFRINNPLCFSGR